MSTSWFRNPQRGGTDAQTEHAALDVDPDIVDNIAPSDASQPKGEPADVDVDSLENVNPTDAAQPDQEAANVDAENIYNINPTDAAQPEQEPADVDVVNLEKIDVSDAAQPKQEPADVNADKVKRPDPTCTYVSSSHRRCLFFLCLTKLFDPYHVISMVDQLAWCFSNASQRL
jgi:hypothetical protein